MFDTLLSVLAPHYCMQCGRLGSLWCDGCSSLGPAVADRCYRCHRLASGGRTCASCRRASPLYGVQAATRYEGYAKQLVWKVKFVRAQAGAQTMAELMAARCRPFGEAVIIPLPTSTSRIRRRGYDQAVLLAKHLARQTRLPYQPSLVRLGQQQQHTASRRLRLTQLSNAFVVTAPERITGKHIVLVDDVITTGATLEAAAHALKKAGAKRVSAIVFAQA